MDDNEAFFQTISSTNSDPKNPTPQDNVLDNYGLLPMDGGVSSSNLYSTRAGSRRGRQPRKLLLAGDKSENSNDEDKKKLMHRDIERQRRQEMGTLYSSLRTLLPIEYIKGKRAISDHMNGAVSYIKDLQKRIEELSAKRDALKKVSSGYLEQGTSSNESFPSSAVVRQSLDGVEVVVSTGLGAQALTLSKVLQLLLEEGLDVVSCISTRIDGGLIHTIQAEVRHTIGVDIPELEQKLNEQISHP